MQSGVVHCEDMKRMVKPPLNANKVIRLVAKNCEAVQLAIFRATVARQNTGVRSPVDHHVILADDVRRKH
jgi:hypothetical protein